jgi:DhnA family fructose-bisphosphate aldolase class Ia
MEKIEPVNANIIVKKGIKSYIVIAIGIIIIVILVVVVAIVAGVFDSRKNLQNISSFYECAEAGFPIMESYPRQCRTSDGKTFTEDLN